MKSFSIGVLPIALVSITVPVAALTVPASPFAALTGVAGTTVEDSAVPSPLEAVPDPFVNLAVTAVTELPELPGVPPIAANSPHDTEYSARVRASFRVQVRDVVIPYRVLALTALPGEVLVLEVEEIQGEGALESFRLRAEDGPVAAEAPGRWRWQAPDEPGVYAVRVESPIDGDAIHLNVLVLHPFSDIRDGSLNGYRIGSYRPAPGRDDPPAGFIEATDEVLDIRVAPGFTLRQFLCKQPGEPPYVALSEPLLLKLEAVLEEVRADGIPAPTFHLMSAFRTPHYNRAIGNTTDGSRHLWGDAADIFIDMNGNGRMDDLNGDGRVTTADGEYLAALVERVERRGEAHVRPGGLSVYAANAVRGPFVHVDARGVPARW